MDSYTAETYGDQIADVYGQWYDSYDTFFALLTQAGQVRCFRNVAQRLQLEGLFLIEAFVPNLMRFEGNQAMRAVAIDDSSVRLDVSHLDPVRQQVTGQHVVISEHGTRLYPIKLRYAWPSELDLMAQLAGLQLRDRWGSWHRAPFTAESTKHILVYAQAERG